MDRLVAQDKELPVSSPVLRTTRTRPTRVTETSGAILLAINPYDPIERLTQLGFVSFNYEHIYRLKGAGLCPIPFPRNFRYPSRP